MRRHHYLYGRTRYLAAPAVPDHLGELHRRTATEQAQAAGLFDPERSGLWTHPDLSRMLYADGKVITPLFKAKPGDKKIDKHTGEVQYPRTEHDAALHVEGTGEMVWGTKYVLIAARHPHPHSRYIVDVAHVPTSGAGAGVAVDHPRTCIEQSHVCWAGFQASTG